MPTRAWGPRGELNSNLHHLHVLGVAAGLGAGDPRTALAPTDLARAGLAERLWRSGLTVTWHTLSCSDASRISLEDRFNHVLAIALATAQGVERAIDARKRFLVLGGDHSIAAGTWSGAARALHDRGPIGLVWIDAHMDAHVPETSPTGNWHGMPIAHLLGHGRSELAALSGHLPAIRPENLCLVGVRSFEPDEAIFLERLGVHVIRMDEVRRRGLAASIEEALTIARRGTVGFGISLDVDSIDPTDAPGVGTPVPLGISGRALIDALDGLACLPDCIGSEIVEFNPALDRHGRTRTLIADLAVRSVTARCDALA